MSESTTALPAGMKIQDVPALKDQLSPLVDTAADVVLDGAGCEAIDFAGAQVLLVLQENLNRAGHQLRIERASPCLEAALTELGMPTLLHSED